MTDPAAARAFLATEIEGMAPFDFLVVSPAGRPLHAIEVTRLENGGLELRVPGRLGIAPELPVEVREVLRKHGLTSEDPSDQTLPWTRSLESAESALDEMYQLFVEAFGEKPDLVFDLAHGSHRAEYEARRKVAEITERVQGLLEQDFPGTVTRDADGDFVIPLGEVHVTIAPRAAPAGPVIVRVFAITNVGVVVAPELGLFLARLNFTLMFGRFALDAERRSVWFDETLLGEHFSDEELRFTIRVVAATADEWDDRLKQMFGGATYQEVITQGERTSLPSVKPGSGGYL